MLAEFGFNRLVFEESKAKDLETCIRKLCSLTSGQPVVSCGWDTCHIYSEGGSSEGGGSKDSGGGGAEITTGRWKKAVDEIKGQFDGEKIVEIVEVCNVMVLKTKSYTLAARISCSTCHVERVTVANHSLQVDTVYSMQGSDQAYVQLDDGSVHLSTFNSDLVLELGRPLLPTGVTVQQVSCGTDHVLLLAQGRVWSSGLNHRGQLGHGDIEPRTQPCIVEGLDGVAMDQVSCGNWHSLALSQCGDIYSWGSNADKQLGHSAESATVAIPTLVDVGGGETDFKCVCCGARHSVGLTTQGLLFTWGWNEYGQLGHSVQSGASLPPAQVSMYKEVLWVHCGPWSTFILTAC